MNFGCVWLVVVGIWELNLVFKKEEIFKIWQEFLISMQISVCNGTDIEILHRN